MAEHILTLRELNRATLARQMLLERASVSATEAVEQLVGLQAQQAVAPYIGLWTRVDGFTREMLADAIARREVVKATLMRATLHLFSARDYLRYRGTLHEVLAGASADIAKSRGQSFDVPALLSKAREYIAETPRTFSEISAWVAELMPESDVGAMRYTIRTHLPLVQVPTDTQWGYPGNPRFTLTESWLGQPIPDTVDTPALIRRYLAAFGPATIADMETWSYLKLKPIVETMRGELATYRDERKRELFDLPNMPLPDADTFVPERFLPEYDNLLQSHKVRTRVVADEYKKRVYLPALRLTSTFLVDGFVAGVWKIARVKKTATLQIEPLAPLPPRSRDALADEGERLVRFVELDAGSYEVKFVEP